MCTTDRASRWLEGPDCGLKGPPLFPQGPRPDLILANSVPVAVGEEQEVSMLGRVPGGGGGDLLCRNLETRRSGDSEDPSSILRLTTPALRLKDHMRGRGYHSSPSRLRVLHSVVLQGRVWSSRVGDPLAKCCFHLKRG